MNRIQTCFQLYSDPLDAEGAKGCWVLTSRRANALTSHNARGCSRSRPLASQTMRTSVIPPAAAAAAPSDGLSAEVAALKEEGNALFRASEFLRAAATYTRAIKLAGKDGSNGWGPTPPAAYSHSTRPLSTPPSTRHQIFLPHVLSYDTLNLKFISRFGSRVFCQPTALDAWRGTL